MPLFIVSGDITKLEVDAIVNAANSSLLGGGGVDGAIHRAAGRQLLEECRGLGGCDTGDAKITGGYNLPAKHIIHTVGPIWHGGSHGEEELLRSCYNKSLQLAVDNDCESVAFPLISTGVYGYPKKEGFEVAKDTIIKFLQQHDLTVYIVIFEASSFDLDGNIKREIRDLLDKKQGVMRELRCESADDKDRGGFLGNVFRNARLKTPSRRSEEARSAAHAVVEEEKEFSVDGAMPMAAAGFAEDACAEEEAEEATPAPADVPAAGSAPAGACAAAAPIDAAPMAASGSYRAASAKAMVSSDLTDLARRVSMIDESFSQMLLRKIDELGMTDVECYKKANLDRKHFSKIRSDKNYRPKKQTVLALAVAMQLPLPQMRELLMKAGYALSDSSVTDVIIEYFVSKGNYNIYDINDALFAFDQPMLGAV